MSKIQVFEFTYKVVARGYDLDEAKEEAQQYLAEYSMKNTLEHVDCVLLEEVEE